MKKRVCSEFEDKPCIICFPVAAPGRPRPRRQRFPAGPAARRCRPCTPDGACCCAAGSAGKHFPSMSTPRKWTIFWKNFWKTNTATGCDILWPRSSGAVIFYRCRGGSTKSRTSGEMRRGGLSPDSAGAASALKCGRGGRSCPSAWGGVGLFRRVKSMPGNPRFICADMGAAKRALQNTPCFCLRRLGVCIRVSRCGT